MFIRQGHDWLLSCDLGSRKKISLNPQDITRTRAGAMVGTITETWSFERLVKLSGWRNVVTTNDPPTALVHGGAADERIV